MNTAVEIERPIEETEHHPNVMWEIQQIDLVPELRFEKTVIIINDVDDGLFVINWIDTNF